MKLGEKIKTLRKGKFTQEQLAEKVGVHINTILRWERGNRVPDANSLAKIAEVLETTPSELLDKDTNSLMSLKESVQEVKNEKQADPPAEKHVTVDEKRGKLSYTFGNGEKLELPDTEKGYALFEKILMQKIGLDLGKVAPAV